MMLPVSVTLPPMLRLPVMPTPPNMVSAPLVVVVLEMLLVISMLLLIRVALLLLHTRWLLSPLKVLALPANCMVPGGPKLGVLDAAVSWKLPSGNTIPRMRPAVLLMVMLPSTCSLLTGTAVPMPNLTLALSKAKRLLPANRLFWLNWTAPLPPPGGV